MYSPYDEYLYITGYHDQTWEETYPDKVERRASLYADQRDLAEAVEKLTDALNAVEEMDEQDEELTAMVREALEQAQYRAKAVQTEIEDSEDEETEWNRDYHPLRETGC